MSTRWKRGDELWELYDTVTGQGKRRGTKDEMGAKARSLHARHDVRPGRYAIRRVL